MRIVQEALTLMTFCCCPPFARAAQEVSLITRLTRGIILNTPLVSAAMDTVTEARLASRWHRKRHRHLHKNMTFEQQARQVLKVKKFESGRNKNRSLSRRTPASATSSRSQSQHISACRW